MPKKKQIEEGMNLIYIRACTQRSTAPLSGSSAAGSAAGGTVGSSAGRGAGALLFTGRSNRTPDKRSAGPTSAIDLPHQAAQRPSALCLSFPICKTGIMILILLCEALYNIITCSFHLQQRPLPPKAGTRSNTFVFSFERKN